MDVRVKKGLKYIEYAATGVLMVLSVYVAVSYAFGVQTIYVVSDNPSSMSPTINYGAIVITYPTPFTSLHVGDIIVFHDPRGNPGIIVHRIVGVSTCGGAMCVQTKGDNHITNPTPDPWNVTARYYLSQVMVVVPDAGYLSPALWGFGGSLSVLPLSFVAILALFVAYGLKGEKKDV